MAHKVRDICRDIKGLTIGNPDDAIACVLIDRDSNLRALVLPSFLIIQRDGFISEIALDDVESVEHDVANHRLIVKTKSGRLVISTTK